ncbi:DMT family transporter [Paracoccus fontiphilus]|uniref:DMT family transporter n=1 Tax=Paracoccus fontiphilus TaxID=1815556 RepID=A0ABV7IPB5_9RHOB|nr:DMT family transporter [Paracoccus fontiphilus]
MSHNGRAALLMVLSMAAFAGEDTLLKLLSTALPTGQLLLLVGFGGMIAYGLWITLCATVAWRDLLHPGVMIRNLADGVCAICYIVALQRGDLSIVSAILQALPLLMTLGAALFLGEPVGWRRWLSIALGFIGVLMIVRPGTDAFEPSNLLAVVAVILLAVRDLATRRLPKRIDTGLVTASAFGMMGLSGIVLMILGRQSFVMPSPGQGGALVATLAFGLLGYVTMVIATRLGEISAIAPFRYSRLIFAIILGVLVFGERPDAWTLSGGAIIALAGIYTMWRESRLRRRTASMPMDTPLPPA